MAIVQILGGESAAENVIYVETEDGAIYQGQLYRMPYEADWVQLSELPEYFQTDVSAKCQSEYPSMREPPHEMVQCITVHGGVGLEFFRETNYALLDDGNI